jgi:hypothetical protein
MRVVHSQCSHNGLAGRLFPLLNGTVISNGGLFNSHFKHRLFYGLILTGSNFWHRQLTIYLSELKLHMSKVVVKDQIDTLFYSHEKPNYYCYLLTTTSNASGAAKQTVRKLAGTVS